ncbi:sodium/calcium exchanger 3 isoform X2 [Chrysoperla carnea]|uniref:sodium/calcium exchanger 3 isoform X2 n=1 Tax=Chrysoperla carnea TaxID=189513 RepID=UPI001D0947A6|nr:sodium/calcium exchanger 3 isoform X2 [Chrysoperla carnea]
MPKFLRILAIISLVCVSHISCSRNHTIVARKECIDGLVIPCWRPYENLQTIQVVGRGCVYFLVLLYLFIGVSIISDRFMAAIEVITSQEREVKIKIRNPKKEVQDEQIIVVRVWNETVANLTLMALGSSAPEILLSIIEIYAKNFQAGELGPSTIVGSAAYNLFVIIAICVLVIPNGEVRKIKHLRVFFVTATWSVFAYVWLYLILAVITPGVVDVWEGAITFLFFPTTVLTAYIADRRLLIYKYLHKDFRMNQRGTIVQVEALNGPTDQPIELNGLESQQDLITPIDDDFELTRNEYINTLKDLRKKYPHYELEQLEYMAHEIVLNNGPKSRAFYRIQATRKMMGSGGNILRKISERAQSDLSEIKAELQQKDCIEETLESDVANKTVSKVYFEPGHYTVMENCGEFTVRVVRTGNLDQQFSVEYQTEDGTAEAGTDYIKKHGTLHFNRNETEKRIQLQVIDDDVFEQDEHFYIRLKNVHHDKQDAGGIVELASPMLATVMILDDDHAGIFNFIHKDYEIIESVGQFELQVRRYSGARGRVILPFWTIDGTAKNGKDFEPVQDGQLVFENNETEKIIQLNIIEEDSYEKDVLFYVQLGEPRMSGDEVASIAERAELKPPDQLTKEEKMALLGRPILGDLNRAQIRIKESKEFKNTVDKLVQRANASIIVGTSSWKEQFIDALTVSPGNDDDDDKASPSAFDYIMHFLTVFWKVIFAFVPPTDICGGYLCFVVSIFGIGVVTAVIGDVASHFGFTLGIEDSVTAIVFVALGTSIPDTFASKVAAKQDKYADASVGNVTGSNAVNVFLGIGVAWSIAAVYHEWNGNKFRVNPGNLAFSVTIFCTEAFICISILLVRRTKCVGGELGGPKLCKWITAFFMFSLWLFYLLMSILEVYGVVEGF